MSNQNINSNNAMSDEEYARVLQGQFFADGPEQLASENNGSNVHNEQNNMQAGKDGGILVKDFINICDQYKTANNVIDYLLRKMPSLVKDTKYSPWDVNYILGKVDIGKFHGVNYMYDIVDYSEKTLGSVPDDLSPKYIEFLFLESRGYDEDKKKDASKAKDKKEDASNAKKHEEFCRWVCRFMINYVKKISNGPNKPNMEFANDEIVKTFFFDSEGNKRKKSEVAKFLGTDDAIFKSVIENKLNTDFIIYLLQNNVGVALEDDFLKQLMKKNGYQQENIETIISKKNELWANSLTGSDLLQKDSYINKLLDGKIKSDKINFTDEEKTRVRAIKNIVLDINKILVETNLDSAKEYKNEVNGLLEFNLSIYGNENETKNFIQRAKSALDLLKKSKLISVDASDIGDFLNHRDGAFAETYNLVQSDFVKSYIVGIICELNDILNFSVQKSFFNVLKSLKENVFTDNEEKQCALKKLFIKALIAKFKDKEIGNRWAKNFPIKDILEYKYRFDTEKSNENTVCGQDSGLDQSDWEYFYCCCDEFGVDINKYWPNEANEKNVEYKNKYENEMKLALEKNKKSENEIKDENSQLKEYEQGLVVTLLTGEFDVQIENANQKTDNNVQPQAKVEVKEENEDNKDNEENNVNNVENNNPNTEVKKDKDNIDVKENQNENKEQMPEVANNDYGLPNDIFKDIVDCVNKMAADGNNLHDDFITDLNNVASKAKDDDIRRGAKMCFIEIFCQKYIEKIAAYGKELFVVKMMGKLFKDHGIDLSNVDNYLNANGAYNGLVNRGQGQGEDAKGILKQKEQLFVDIKKQLRKENGEKDDLFVDGSDINCFETVWDAEIEERSEQNKNVEQEDNVHEESKNQNINNPKQNENKPVEENNGYALDYRLQQGIDEGIKNMKELGNDDLPGHFSDKLNQTADKLGNVSAKLASEAKSYFMDKFFSDCIEKVSQFGDKNLFVVLMIDHMFSQLKVPTEDTKIYLEAHKNLNELKKQPNEQNQEELKNMEQDLSQKFEAVLGAFEDAVSDEQCGKLIHINKTDIENFMIKWDKSVEEYNKKSPEDKKFANLFHDGMPEEELETALAKMDNQNNISDDNNNVNQLNKNAEEGEEDEVDALKEEAITMLMSEAYGLTVENIITVDSEIDSLGDNGHLPAVFLTSLIGCDKISQNAIRYFIDKLFYNFKSKLKEGYSGKVVVFKFEIAEALSKSYPVEILAIENYKQTISEESIQSHLTEAAIRAVQMGIRFNEQDRDNEKNNFVSQAYRNAINSVTWGDMKDYISTETVSYFMEKFSELDKGEQNKYGEILQNEEAIEEKKEELRQKKIQEWKNKIKQESESQKPEKKEELNPEETIKQRLKSFAKEEISDGELKQIINDKNNKSEVTNEEKEHTGTIKDSEQQIPFNQNTPSFLTDRKRFYEKKDNDNIEKKQNSVEQSQQPIISRTEKQIGSENKNVETNPNPLEEEQRQKNNISNQVNPEYRAQPEKQITCPMIDNDLEEQRRKNNISNQVNPEYRAQPEKQITCPMTGNDLEEQKQKNSNDSTKNNGRIQIRSNNQIDEQQSESKFILYFVVSMIALVILLALTFVVSSTLPGIAIFIVFDGAASVSAIYNGIQCLRLYFANDKLEPAQPFTDINSDKNNNLDIDKVKDQISNDKQNNNDTPVIRNDNQEDQVKGQG